MPEEGFEDILNRVSAAPEEFRRGEKANAFIDGVPEDSPAPARKSSRSRKGTSKDSSDLSGGQPSGRQYKVNVDEGLYLALQGLRLYRLREGRKASLTGLLRELVSRGAEGLPEGEREAARFPLEGEE